MYEIVEKNIYIILADHQKAHVRDDMTETKY